MNRLTRNQLENYRNTYDRFDGIESSEFEKICDELIEYKAFEEELGISLPILFKKLSIRLRSGYMNSNKKKYENMTPLEALEWIDAYSDDDVYHNITNEVNIIKKALSRLEQLEKENQELKETINDLQKDYDALDFEQVELYAENTKLKKALDVLKRLVGVNSIVIFPKERVVDITQEEYELLKSVLEE